MPQPRQHSAHGRMLCLPRILSRRANRCDLSGGYAASAGAAWLHQSGRRPANTKESGESGRGWQSPASGGGSASASASASAAGSPAWAPSAPPPPPAVGSPPPAAAAAASAAASASAAAAPAAAAGGSGTHPLQPPPSSSGSARGRPRAATWCTRALQARANAAAWCPAGARRRAARSPAHLLVSSGTRRALFKRARSHHTPLSTGGRARPHSAWAGRPPPPPPHPPSDVGRSRRPAGPRAWLQRQRGRWLRRRRCILGLLRGQARLAARVPRGPAARARLAQQRRAGAPARLKRAQLGGRAACAARGPGAWRRAPAIARRRGALAPPGHTHARRPVAISCCGRLCCIKTVRAVALGRQGACARSQAPNHRLCPTGQAQGRVRAWQLGRRQEGKLERGLHARHALLAVPRLQLQPHLPRPRPARRRRSPPEPAGISRSLYRLTTSQAEAIASAQGWAATDAPRVPAAGRGRAARRAAAARARPPCERRQGRRPVERASQRGGRAAGAHRIGQQAHPVALRLRHNGCWRALPLAPRLLPRQRLPAQPQGALRGPAETSDPAGQAAARLPAPPSRCNRTGAPALPQPHARCARLSGMRRGGAAGRAEPPACRDRAEDAKPGTICAAGRGGFGAGRAGTSSPSA